MSVDNRLRGLAPDAQRLLAQTAQHLARSEFDHAAAQVAQALALAPDHPEVQRFHAVVAYQSGRVGAAIEGLRRALSQWPDDAILENDLGNALERAGDREAALGAWRRACELKPDYAIAWFNLGRCLRTLAWTAESAQALEHALTLDPNNAAARCMLGDVLVHLGRIDAAVGQFRQALRRRPTFGDVWWSLANIKTLPLSSADSVQLAAALKRSDLSDADRIPMQFAFAKSLEDAGRYADAYAAFVTANDLAHGHSDWDRAQFHARVVATLQAFAAPVAAATDPGFGHEAIFVVSLPRAGSTLTEQILAAHPLVEGASELTDLGEILHGESQRRRRRFHEWAPDANAQDWRRMGQEYLDRTVRWRKDRPRHTDKMPNNWLLIGAIRAMLPGARIVDCRRDALETCFSCFKQLFFRGVEYSYDIDDLGAHWHDYDRALRAWHARYPGSIREQGYEALVTDAEREIRSLLRFCDLPFATACLAFHEAGRSVRTASAAQVREPLRKDTARSARYGALLDPLRRALATDGLAES